MSTVKDYIAALPEGRAAPFKKLRAIIKKNLPKGFKEEMNYGMVGYVVPHSIYPDGYHCDTALPLPFANIANQKNFIGLYHMGIYATPELKDWFVESYAEACKYKLDMGKSCIRLKKMDDIPYDLIGELMTKMTVKDWIDRYEGAVKK